MKAQSKRIDEISDDDLAALMKTAQAGDIEAYSQLLQEVTIRLRRIVRRYRSFLSDEDIEDLVQDILLSLHSVRATYDPRRPFMPWLLAITRNRLADGARRYARTSGREVNNGSQPPTSTRALGASSSAKARTSAVLPTPA